MRCKCRPSPPRGPTVSSICSWQAGPAAPDAKCLRKPTVGTLDKRDSSMDSLACSPPISPPHWSAFGRVERVTMSSPRAEAIQAHHSWSGLEWPRRNFEIHVGHQWPELHTRWSSAGH